MKSIERGTIMRVVLALLLLFVTSGAQAQQCGECILADACIKEYTRAKAKIRAETKRGTQDWQKGLTGLELDDETAVDLSRRGSSALQSSMETMVRFEIEKLKECLGKIR